MEQVHGDIQSQALRKCRENYLKGSTL